MNYSCKNSEEVLRQSSMKDIRSATKIAVYVSMTVKHTIYTALTCLQHESCSAESNDLEEEEEPDLVFSSLNLYIDSCAQNRTVTVLLPEPSPYYLSLCY